MDESDRDWDGGGRGEGGRGYDGGHHCCTGGGRGRGGRMMEVSMLNGWGGGVGVGCGA